MTTSREHLTGSVPAKPATVTFICSQMKKNRNFERMVAGAGRKIATKWNDLHQHGVEHRP